MLQRLLKIPKEIVVTSLVQDEVLLFVPRVATFATLCQIRNMPFEVRPLKRATNVFKREQQQPSACIHQTQSKRERDKREKKKLPETGRPMLALSLSSLASIDASMDTTTNDSFEHLHYFFEFLEKPQKRAFVRATGEVRLLLSSLSWMYLSILVQGKKCCFRARQV
jgi:hypothetical protein